MLIGGAPYDKDKAEKVDEAVKMLEEYLTRNKWAAGSQMTLADISLLSSVSTLEVKNEEKTLRAYSYYCSQPMMKAVGERGFHKTVIPLKLL